MSEQIIKIIIRLESFTATGSDILSENHQLQSRAALSKRQPGGRIRPAPLSCGPWMWLINYVDVVLDFGEVA